MSELLSTAPAGKPLTAEQAAACATAAPMLAKLADGGFSVSALREIIQKRAVLTRARAGEIVILKGTYGGDVFFPMRGALRAIEEDPDESHLRELSLKRRQRRGFSIWRTAFRALLPSPPEMRDHRESAPAADRAARLSIARPDEILARCKTRRLTPENCGVVGEQAALIHGEQPSTIFAEEDSLLLKMNWRGFRALHRGSADFRAAARRQQSGVQSILAVLRGFSLTANLPDAGLEEIAAAAEIQIHGDREWGRAFAKRKSAAAETVIIRQGDHLNDLMLVLSGFGRLSEELDAGERTVQYLRRGDSFGLSAIAQSMKSGRPPAALRTLRAVEHLELLLVPVQLAQKHIRLSDALSDSAPTDKAGGWMDSAAAADFLIGHRLFNGAKAMLVDLNRCVDCDDCVRACAAAHGGNPRFVRAGPTLMNVMAASACMHCVEPMCLADCPTGAIHRDAETGNVIIDDPLCVGCGACASGCPYDNIRLVDARTPSGEPARNAAGLPVVKATKCDFCRDIDGGPACQRACPHNALTRADMADWSVIAPMLTRARA